MAAVVGWWLIGRSGGDWTRARVAVTAVATTLPLLAGWLLTAAHLIQARSAALAAAQRELEDDLTDRRAVDAALQSAREELEASQRELAATNTHLDEARRATRAAEGASRAKSDFIAVTSHEIRTPLSGIVGFTQLLGESPLSPEQKDWVETIQSASQTLLELINDVLDLSKIEAGQLTLESIAFDPAAVARAVVSLLGTQGARKGLMVELQVEPGLPEHVQGDLVRYKQILCNLVGNAVKFTPNGGVKVGLRWARESDQAGTLQTWVQDTGIGIARERQAQVFETYKQADGSIPRRYGGNGLGLAICKRLVEIQSGQIGLESEPERGSRFWFDLPYALVAPLAEPATVRPSLPLSPGTDLSKRLHVLLAEDTLVNQKLAISLLQRQGCDIELVENGRDAVERSGLKRFDIVFMDCHMPEMDGFEAARAIRRLEAELGEARGHRRPGRLPIVAITANAIQGDREACLEAGMDDYISKPYRPEDLTRVLLKWTRAGLRDAA